MGKKNKVALLSFGLAILGITLLFVAMALPDQFDFFYYVAYTFMILGIAGFSKLKKQDDAYEKSKLKTKKN